MGTKAAVALVRALQDLGVSLVFGLPGVQNAELYDALATLGMRQVLVRHEQSAVHMAHAWARVTGTVGVVFATSGPGATNTVTGIATAYMDSVPVVVITGQVPTSAIGTDAFQEADITTITLPITKHSYLVKEAAELVPTVFEAFYLAASGRPGPVLIDVPGNVATAPVDYQPPRGTPSLASYKPTICGNARQVRSAATLLATARRPVLLVGGGVVSSAAEDALRTLAESAAMPVATTLLAKGMLGASHPLLLGQPGVYGAPAANAALQQADVILAVGTRFSERVTGNAEDFAPEARIIHLDIDPAEIGKNIRVDIPIVGDAATVLTALYQEMQKEGHTGRGEGDPRNAAALRTASALVAPSAPVNQTQQVFAALDVLLRNRRNTILTTDVGQHQLWASHMLAVDNPRCFISSGGLGTMGFGLPAALGAQLASPQSLVLCISGDGSFQMSIQEMALAVVYGLPIKVLIINNGSHGLVRQWQQLFFEKRYTATLLEQTPNYELLAAAYGWQGRTVDARQAAFQPATESPAQLVAPAAAKAEVPPAQHPRSATNHFMGEPAVQSALQEALAWLLEEPGPALLNVLVPTEDLLEPFASPGGSLNEVR